MQNKNKTRAILCVIVVLLALCALWGFVSFFTKGKQLIEVQTAKTYYNGSEINAIVNVKHAKKDKLIDAKVTAELYNQEKKKVKGVKYVQKIDKGESANVLLELPENLESGNYNLRITSQSGLLKDKTEIDINIINDIKSNVVISLDKGIYKPGDEVNFRALILSKKENKPVENEVSLYIFDGNNNKVYSETTKTSEYGIVSGTFQLANEVNSGTYKLSVVTETQEVNKYFTVNPYITPKFEANITTDKESYIVGDEARITLTAKYFFGEPVKGANVVGEINGKEVVGITNESGIFEKTYKIEKEGSLKLDFDITDSSNYLIEANKTVLCGTDIFEIEILPEYKKIVTGIDNEIYVLTKNIDGTPVKTYSTINLGKITKQVISDENGVGKLVLTESEIGTLETKDLLNVKITAKDMENNEISKTIPLEKMTTKLTLVSTDKVLYQAGEDIEIELDSKNDLSNTQIFILKNGELIKSLSTEEENTIVNLENVTGLVDIIVPQNTSTRYSNSYLSNYSKKTIFINPSQKLNIDIKTDSQEYRPGENLTINFTTTDENNSNVDAALLVSILDEAILSLAENDLSVDNLKLALEDIKLTDGMTAADLAAIVLSEKDDVTLNSILLKQEVQNVNIINKKYVNYYTEGYLGLAIISTLVALIIIGVYLFLQYEKVRKAIIGIIIPGIIVIAIFILLITYTIDIFEDILYDVHPILAIATYAVLSIILYILYLYKERDLLFRMIIEFAVIPVILYIIYGLVLGFVYNSGDYNYRDYDQISSSIILFAILVYSSVFAILTAKNKKEKLTGDLKKIHNFCKVLLRTIIFLGCMCVIEPLFEEWCILIGIIVYVLFNKFVFKNTKTKMVDRKIVLNINASEVLGMIIGVGMIGLILIMIVFALSNNFAGSTITDSMTSSETISRPSNGFVPKGTIGESDSSSSSSGGGLTFGDMGGEASNFVSAEASDTSGSGSSINGGIFDFSLSDVKSSNSSKNDYVNQEVTYESSTNDFEEIEKQVETKETVRNVFLESLAFIPELVTEGGKAEYTTKLSDNITTWSIQTIGNTKNGNVGYGSANFKVFKEFFVDFTLPTNSVVTDKTSIPVTLYNYTEGALTVNVKVASNDWATIGTYPEQVTVPAKSTNMIYIPIEILKDGNQVLRIETSSGNVSDIVEKTLEVKPNGLEVNQMVSSGIISDKYSQDIIFDEDAIEGTKNVKVRLYATPLVQAIENIEGMLQLPTGCFEQTSSSLYPDIYVLKHLKENRIDNEELNKKALEYISTGYQKLLTYEVSGTKGGYSLYGNSPAEPVITAFGLMEMDELSQVYEIDENVVKNMKEYLFDEQKSNGTFKYRSTYIGGAASTNELAMNAYIIWALSEVCPDDQRLEKSVNYLKKEMEDTDDSYTLALMANVFANTNNKTEANDVIKQLKSRVVVENNGSYLTSGINDYYGTRGRYQTIQTTALASLALTKLNSNQDTNEEFVKYIYSAKDYRGTWGTTQATVLALKAITEFSEGSDIKEQTVVVSINGEEQKIDIGKNSLDVYELDFENLSVENHFSIELEKGKMSYEIVKNYYEKYDNAKENDKFEITQTIDTVAKVNDIITQSIEIVNRTVNVENGLLEVNIPQGCTPIEESLLELKYDGKIEKYEYNYGKIYIYLRTFNTAQKVKLDIQYRALYPEQITGAAIRFYDYYNPEIEDICKPVNITVTE